MIKTLSKYNLLLIAVVFLGLGRALNPAFFAAGNLTVIFYQFTVLGILAIAASLVLLSGEIDLSIGASVIISPALAIHLTNYLNLKLYGKAIMRGGYITGNWWLIVVLTLAIATLIGVLNAVIVVKGKVPAFITTIGMQFTITGVGFLVTKGTPLFLTRVRGADAIGNHKLLSCVPVCFFIFAAVAGAFIFLNNKTRFGMRLYSTGGNPRAATICGVSPGFWKMLMFVLSGFLTGVTGVIFMSKLQSVDVTQIAGYSMTALAIAVIGGIELQGGVGKLGNAVAAAGIFAVFTNIMNLIGFLSYHRTFVTGLIIVFFAVMHKRRDSRRLRLMNQVEV